MKAIIDTPVWSLAFRRKAKALSEKEHQIVEVLSNVISSGRAILLGSIRQEILSGIPQEKTFNKLAESLRVFPDLPLTIYDYEEAARCHNLCRASGVAGSSVDFLICGIAIQREFSIFTLDKDFQHYSKILPIKLNDVRL